MEKKGVIATIIVLMLLAVGSGAYLMNASHSIEYELNGGVNSPNNPTSYKYGKTVVLEPATRDGYVFTGWYSNPELTVKFDILTTLTFTDVKAYAGWIYNAVGTEVTYSMSGTVKTGIGSSTSIADVVTTATPKSTYDFYCSGDFYLEFAGSYKYVLNGLNRTVSLDQSTWQKYNEFTWTKDSKTTDITLPNNEVKTCTVYRGTYEVTNDGMTYPVKLTRYLCDSVDYKLEYVGPAGTYYGETATLTFEYTSSTSVVPPTEITHTFTWKYRANETGLQSYSCSLTISFEDYADYRNDPNAVRWQSTDVAARALVTSNDKYISQLADKLDNIATSNGWNHLQRAQFVLAFVQYIDYLLDSNSRGQSEFWKYPVETLFDEAGDCEDTSILYCAIMKHLGEDTAMLVFSDHMAAAIAIDGASGTYYSFGGKDYFYCETTGTGYTIGTQPSSITETHAKVIVA